jgi:hypothetical protein
MLRKLFLIASLTGFALVAVPVIGPQIGLSDTSAQAATVKKKGKMVKRLHNGKYQYVYVPTSSGRPGAWR